MRINLLLAIICGSALMCADALPARAEAFRVGLPYAPAPARWAGARLRAGASLRIHHETPDPAVRLRRTVRRVGLDIGVTSAGTLSWAVFARNSRVGPGTLRGATWGRAAMSRSVPVSERTS